MKTIDIQEAKDLAKEVNCQFFKVSAKTGENIEKLFHHIAEELVKSTQKFDVTKPNSSFCISDSLTTHTYCDGYKPKKKKNRW
jgi:50S ribosomal subunit-associated GTPase HflX